MINASAKVHVSMLCDPLDFGECLKLLRCLLTHAFEFVEGLMSGMESQN